jgi:NAD(P)-dependent dehydrogenase (short-subunit alcohol dehydrogenase family)
MANWTGTELRELPGRSFLVTGANSGLGAATASALAAGGATVTLACRNTAKGQAAAAAMTGDVSVRALDLADLDSVHTFAAGTAPFDVLINNAGIMAVPKGRTTDGFELQFGTNHLGHFALTGLLLPRVRDRIVTVSSFAHRMGRIDLVDPNFERRHYDRWLAYGQSKLANLMFAYELQRRLAASGSALTSVAAHPGYAATELQSHTESIQDRFMTLSNRAMAQSAEHGAWPSLYAATVDSLQGGEFIGPDGPLQLRGRPRVVGSSSRSKDRTVASRLWSLSEELTGVSYLN